MSATSDPSYSLARRSRIAGFGSSPFELSSGNGSSPLDRPSTAQGGRARQIASYESFLHAAQQAQNMESSTSIAASPPLVKRHFCDLQYGTNMAASPDSVATARSITTADTVNSAALPPPMPLSGKKAQKSHKRLLSHAVARAQSRSAQRLNDSMVYLEGPAVYSCGECGTHLTTNDDIISKSFHGHHGRAFLLDTCVNVTIGPAEDRRLLTGLHSVCDILCKRCNTKVGWTYKRAYELSQKYKEGKFIVEKIFLSLEDDDDGGANTLFDCRRYGSSSWSNQETSWSRSYASMDSSISELSPRSSFASTEKMVYEY